MVQSSSVTISEYIDSLTDHPAKLISKLQCDISSLFPLTALLPAVVGNNDPPLRSLFAGACVCKSVALSISSHIWMIRQSFPHHMKYCPFSRVLRYIGQPGPFHMKRRTTPFTCGTIKAHSLWLLGGHVACFPPQGYWCGVLVLFSTPKTATTASVACTIFSAI